MTALLLLLTEANWLNLLTVGEHENLLRLGHYDTMNIYTTTVSKTVEFKYLNNFTNDCLIYILYSCGYLFSYYGKFHTGKKNVRLNIDDIM